MRFYIHRLGCPKNDVDGDYIAGRLVRDGHELVSDIDVAQVAIVNTCTFILPAKEESIEAILEIAQLKQEGRLERLYVCGCMPQRYADELLASMPEIDGAFGLGELDALAKAVGQLGRNEHTVATDSRQLTYLAGENRLITDSYPYAYLKISDGCSRGCTYCVIPSIRGRFRSRRMADIVDEAAFLASRGKKELILVSQDTSLYGRDLKSRRGLVDLLRALEEVECVTWLRVMYLHPGSIGSELLDYMLAEDNKVLPYFDLPLQHANERLLRAMGRPSRRKQIEETLGRIRSLHPDAVLRTTFIVGFPGETEGEFEELLEFVAQWRFDRLGAFSFSAEEGTRAAAMADQVAEEDRLRRLDLLMSLQQTIAFERNISLIGSTLETIIDDCGNGGAATGRTRGDCPDIDQLVSVTGDGLRVGDIRPVRIERADGYDLHGQVVEA